MLKKIKKKIKKDQSGFVILIAIMVSLILLSVGTFIASVAVREIMLSSSAKQSQAAFFAADAVLECALFKEFKEGGFNSSNYTTHNSDNSLSCNGKYFDWDYSENDGVDTATHEYYISFSDTIYDESGDSLISQDEIIHDSVTKNKPYVKLIVEKSSDFDKTSKIRVYGHNFREGRTIIERAIEVVW